MLPLYKDDNFGYSFRSRIFDKLRGWWRLILADSKSRKLFFFLVINLSFAFVELFYGMLTNSLSLISDSFHMFFDCTGLLAGLIASLITKWRPNDKFSYGYVRAETLAGFVNGLFLLFVAFFIFSEAVERAFEPPDVHHERLLVVSILGFLVNMIGIFFFHEFHTHAPGSSCSGDHGHSHAGHGHGHSHSKHQHDDHGVSNGLSLIPNGNDQGPNPFTTDHHGHGHSHDGPGHGHSHGHSHSEPVFVGENPVQGSDRQIMRGVFLHILADTLGSVGVIISAVLMRMFGWMIADPICSMIIAVLISLSVFPLIKESTCVLMMRSPRELDNSLSGAYQKIMKLEGVYAIQEPHFWTLCTDVYIGMVKLEVSPKCDPKYVSSSAHNILAQVGVKQVYVQLDFAAI